MGKVWRPRRPAEAPLQVVGVKDAQGVAVPVGKKKMRRPAAKAPLKSVGLEDVKGVAVVAIHREVEASSMLEAPVVAEARGHWDKGPLLEDHGRTAAVCRMEDSLDGAPVIAMTPQLKSVGAVLKKDTKEVALRKVWRPRKPAKKAPFKAVGGGGGGVKYTKGVDVVGVDDGEVIKASGLGAPMVAAEKGPLEDGIAMCRIDTLHGATRQKAAVGLMKDARGGVVVGKMWQPRRPRVKAPLKAVGVNDTQGIAVISVDGVVVEKGGPLEDEIAMCLMDSLDQAPVIATTRHEAVEVKNTKGVAVGKMWRPRRPAKDLVEVVGVKDDEGVVVTDVDRKVEASVVLGAPVLMGREKVPLEEGIALCQVDALDGAPVISTTLKEEVGVNNAEGGAVAKRRRPRRSAKKPLEALVVKDAEGVAVITLVGEVEPLVLGVPMVAEVGDRENGPLEDRIMVCPVDALTGAPVIATDEKEEVSVQEDPVVPAAGGREKGSLEDGIVVCRVDALDRAPVISTTREEEVRVKSDEGVAVGKRRRPRRSAKKPLEALGVKKDAEGVAVITLTGEVEPLVLGVPVVAAVGGREKGPLEDGIVVCPVDALNAAPVMATHEKEEVWVQEDPVVAEAGGGEKGSLEDGIVVCPVDALTGAPVIATDEKEEVSVQEDLVVPTAGGREKGSLEDGIVVCQVDALDGDLVISTTRQEEVGVKSDEGVVVGKRRRPRRSVKKPLEALGVKDVEGVAVNTLTGEVEPLVLGVPVVTKVGGRENGPLEDVIVVCRVDTLNGAPVIASDEKEEVSVQGNPVFPAVDQKVDALVLERMQTITVKGNGKGEKDKEGIKWLKHYSTAQSILIIGDGDFSFSLALATTFGSGGNLVATSLDTYGVLTLKYGKAESNVRELERLGATVLHGVDAQTMKLHPYLEMRRFDRIVFNFPHAGFKGKEYQLHVISSHKQLVRGFLANARQLLRPCGEIHLSHKKGFPYDAWGIKKLACESCLIMVRKVDFSKEDYPGYNQKRGDGVTCDDSFPLGPCWTFMFRAGDVEKLKKAHGNRVGSISSCLGDPGKCYPPGMMWPFDLHPAWPQPYFPPVHMPIAIDPCPFGVAGMEGPFNCYGASFHHQHIVQPTHQEQPCWYQEGPPIGHPKNTRAFKGSRKFTGN